VDNSKADFFVIKKDMENILKKLNVLKDNV